MKPRLLLRLSALLVALTGLVAPAVAQGLFSPVLTINDRMINGYQLDQRTRFLTLLGVPENQSEAALTQLTIEALQIQAAEAAGFVPTPEALEAGETEFAARANLTREQFIAALAQGGVDAATFSDFITAGVAWRAYVQDRFRAPAEDLQTGALARALETAEIEEGRRVLLSEIILPANSEESRAVSRARAEGFSQLTTADAFGEAARQFSLAQTRFRSGEVEWRPLSALPEEVVAAVGSLQPGQTSRPVDLGNAIAVFFVRDVEITPATTAQFASVDYARLRLPPGRDAEAAQIASAVDTCEELEGRSGAFSEGAFVRETTLLSVVPADLRGVFDTLDAGEVRVTQRQGNPEVIFLCQRTFGQGAEIDLTLLRLGLINQRLALLSRKHLLDLREEAVIIRPEDG